jgi:hypothetical protein
VTPSDEARLLGQSTDASAVARLREMHSDAVARGDVNLAAEVEQYLARNGYTASEVEAEPAVVEPPADPPAEVADPPATEKAVPAKPEQVQK